MLYALLIRGEIYRYGCDSVGVNMQDRMMRSQHEMITQPLEDCGATVDVLLALDTRGCANNDLRGRLSEWHPNHIRMAANVKAATQPQNIRAALSIFIPVWLRYDVLILTRYDILLLQPFTAWPGCQGTESIGLSSRCEQNQWKQWNCSNDILFVVPRKHMIAFNSSINAPVDPSASRTYRGNGGMFKIAPSACFMQAGESASPWTPRGLGHGCYNSFASRVGTHSLDFCFPTTARVTSSNPYYQCCKHGAASVGTNTSEMREVELSHGQRSKLAGAHWNVTNGSATEGHLSRHLVKPITVDGVSVAVEHITVGREVIISGLVSSPEYNGMFGRVEAQQGDRWAVELHSNGSRLALRPANLVLAGAAPRSRAVGDAPASIREPITFGAQAAPLASIITASPSVPVVLSGDHGGDDPVEGGTIVVGSEVIISGLVSSPEYNGMFGRVEAQQGDRWAVELHSNGSRLALRPANLVLAGAAPVAQYAKSANGMADSVTVSALRAVLPPVIDAAMSATPVSAPTPALAATSSAPVSAPTPALAASVSSTKVGAGVDAIDGLGLLVAGLPMQTQAAAAKWCVEKEWDSVALLVEAKLDDEFIAALNVKLEGGRGVILRKRLAELRASLSGKGARKPADWMGGAQSREG